MPRDMRLKDGLPEGEASREDASDFELLGAWAQGDAAAGDDLVRRHYTSVKRFFDVKITPVAEDLTQRTFLACVESLDRLHQADSFKAYLFGIARNQLLLHLRQSSRLEARHRAFDGPEPKTSMSMVVARREEEHLLLMVLGTLPTDLQIAVELFYWESMRTSEIARVLEIPVSTVTSRLARARELLKRDIYELGAAPKVRDSLISNLEHFTRSLVQRSPTPGPTPGPALKRSDGSR
jgi:RNA polymerase sigma factor (sigma-70 family)